jgi:hypothetical protein
LLSFFVFAMSAFLFQYFVSTQLRKCETQKSGAAWFARTA